MIPPDIRRLAETAAETHKNDIRAATTALAEAARALPEFASVVDVLLDDLFGRLIDEVRHAYNRKQATGPAAHYDPGRRVPAGGTTVLSIFGSIYDYKIGGRTLGDLMGDELPVVAAAERAIASGHTFRAELCDWLYANGCRGTTRVREVFTERRLRLNFNRIRREVMGEMSQAGD